MGTKGEGGKKSKKQIFKKKVNKNSLVDKGIAQLQQDYQNVRTIFTNFNQNNVKLDIAI